MGVCKILDKAMLDDPDCNASVTIVLNLVPYDGTRYRRQPAVDWSIGKPHHQANRGRKFHPTRQPQVKTRSTHVVQETVETEGLIVDVDTPDSCWQSVARAGFSATFNYNSLRPKCRFSKGKMVFKGVIRSLFTIHKGQNS